MLQAECNPQGYASHASPMLSRLTTSHRSDQQSKSLRNEAAPLIAFVAWRRAFVATKFFAMAQCTKAPNPCLDLVHPLSLLHPYQTPALPYSFPMPPPH